MRNDPAGATGEAMSDLGAKRQRVIEDAAIGRAARDLESNVADAFAMSRIAQKMIETALLQKIGEARAKGAVSMLFTAEDLDDLIYIVSEAAYRVRVAHDAYYAAIETGR